MCIWQALEAEYPGTSHRWQVESTMSRNGQAPEKLKECTLLHEIFGMVAASEGVVDAIADWLIRHAAATTIRVLPASAATFIGPPRALSVNKNESNGLAIHTHTHT